MTNPKVSVVFVPKIYLNFISVFVRGCIPLCRDLMRSGYNVGSPGVGVGGSCDPRHMVIGAELPSYARAESDLNHRGTGLIFLSKDGYNSMLWEINIRLYIIYFYVFMTLLGNLEIRHSVSCSNMI